METLRERIDRVVTDGRGYFHGRPVLPPQFNNTFVEVQVALGTQEARDQGTPWAMNKTLAALDYLNANHPIVIDTKTDFPVGSLPPGVVLLRNAAELAATLDYTIQQQEKLASRYIAAFEAGVRAALPEQPESQYVSLQQRKEPIYQESRKNLQKVLEPYLLPASKMSITDLKPSSVFDNIDPRDFPRLLSPFTVDLPWAARMRFEEHDFPVHKISIPAALTATHGATRDMFPYSVASLERHNSHSYAAPLDSFKKD